MGNAVFDRVYDEKEVKIVGFERAIRRRAIEGQKAQVAA